MSLKYAILGLLSFKPQSGYELKTHFNQTIRYIWNADQAQIYRTLSEITKKGLAQSQTVLQEGRPNKKVYELTDTGKAALQDWVSRTLKPKVQRNADLLQVFFAGQASDVKILERFRQIQKEMENGLSGLSSLLAQSELFNKDNSSPRAHFFYDATLQLGIQTMKLNLEWMAELIKKIENGKLSQK